MKNIINDKLVIKSIYWMKLSKMKWKWMKSYTEVKEI